MRVKNSIYNITYGLGSQIIITLLSFVSRTVFIHTLGNEYLGINGLFSNILTMLSLANLGIGGSIAYSLYKPLAIKDEAKIKAYMNFYEKAYRSIGIIVLALGFSILPFLNYFMKAPPNIPHISLIYSLFVINSGVTYFFIYKSSIIVADQKNYIVTRINCLFSIVSITIQIIILITTKNFILSLSLQIILTMIQNSYIAHIANKRYSYIKEKNKERLDKNEKKLIFKNLSALSLYNLSGVIYNGTDNIVISSIIGVYAVGIYSNYYMIISSLKSILGQIFNSLIPSIGNLNAVEDEEKKYFIFNILYLTNFWIYGICSICLVILLNPFITLWLGDKYLLDFFIVFILFIDFFTGGINTASSVFKSSSGLYWYGKFGPIVCVIINLVLSILLVKYIGIAGVILGTLISRLATYSWIDPFITYKYVLKKPLKIYFMKYAIYTAITIFSALLTEIACTLFTTNTFITLIGKCIFCLIIPNTIFYLVFKKTKEFIYLQNLALTMIKRFTISSIK